MMKAKIYVILERAVMEGIESGLRRAYKYTDTPSCEEMKTTIEEDILRSIDEVFDFEDDTNDN